MSVAAPVETPVESPAPRLTDPSSDDRYAHIIRGKDPAAMITEAIVLGTPLEAMCGKRWVPSRDASRFPVCPDCKAVYMELLSTRSSG